MCWRDRELRERGRRGVGGGPSGLMSDACGVTEILDCTAHRVVSLGRPDELTDAIAHLVTPRSKPRRVAGYLRSRLDSSLLVDEQLAMYEEVGER